MNDPADDAYEHVEAFNRQAISSKLLPNSEEFWRKMDELEQKEKLESKD